jgi:hypothetical protein
METVSLAPAGGPGADPETAVRAGAWRTSRYRPVCRVLVLYAASRMVVLLACGMLVYLHNGLAAVDFNGPWPLIPSGRPLFQALGSWDGAWYLLIARHGYFSSYQELPFKGLIGPGAQQAFFPGFPVLVRLTGKVTGLGLLSAGVLSAFVLGAVAALALWALARLLVGAEAAERAVALWVFFPGSFVLSMVYAEGLTVAGAALCLYSLLKKRWVLAGLAAAVATASQPEALAVVPCCAWAAAAWIYRERCSRALLALAAPVLSLLGVLTYFSYLGHKTGDFLRWYHVEKTSWQSGDGFYRNTVHLLAKSVTHPTFIHDSVVAAFFLYVVVTIGLMVRWRPPVVVGLFTFFVLLSALSSVPVGTRGRVVLVAFPLTIATARVVKGTSFTVLVGVFGAFLTTLTVLTLTNVVVAP